MCTYIQNEEAVDNTHGEETAPPFHPPSLYHVCIKKPQTTAYAKTPLLSAKSKQLNARVQ